MSYPPYGRSSEDPQVPSNPGDLNLPPAASTYTPTLDEKMAIIANVTELITHNIDEIESTPSPSYDKVSELFRAIHTMFKPSGIIGFRRSKEGPLSELKKKFYELVFAVMDKWMTNPMTHEKMIWIAREVNIINQPEIPEKYNVLMRNNAQFMKFISNNRSEFDRLFGVLQAAQQPQSVSVAAAAPVASAKQEAAERLVQLIKGLTIDAIDDSMRQQAMTDIATLMSSSTNGGSRKRRSIKPKRSRKTKSRKTKSRKTKSRKTKSRRH
jgi:hypothetical protein